MCPGQCDGSLVGTAKIRWTKQEEVELKCIGGDPAKIISSMKRQGHAAG